MNSLKKEEADLINAGKQTSEGFNLLERAPGVSVEKIVSKTAGKLIVEGQIAEMQFV